MSAPHAPEDEHGAPQGTPEDDPRWLDRPGSVDAIIRLLIVVCVGTVVYDFFVHKHGHWHFQEWIGFDAVFGFVSFVGIVLAGKWMRGFLMRSEDYYD